MIGKLLRQPWVFSFGAAIAVWLVTIAYTGGQGAGAILTAALSFATFTIIVGLGQMMVITTGPGNVDLSIPATITLSGVVAMKVMDEDTGRMAIGIVAALGAATIVGIFNYGLIRLLRIPPIIAAIVIGVAVHLALMLASYGVIARGAGGNPKALTRAGWSMLRTKVVMYMLAGLFGVLSGLALLGLTTSGDAHVADRYTLYSIAGVILGGGEFIGGRVSPLGAVVGALTLALAGSFLIFLKISPDWQIGAQGAILIIVLALRALVSYGEQKR